MSKVAEVVLQFLPPKRKHTPSGWISFNAPCCHHNGQGADTRQRGGLIANPDGGVSYHCFNCGFKASWQPGRNVSKGLRRLLGGQCQGWGSFFFFEGNHCQPGVGIAK